MSARLTASGLQSSGGLFGQCGVYQFDQNSSILNPLDLNPYLLFDAETSMIGTLANPSLDLDPSKQETLDVITATRSGSATFVNILGQIETAPANTVRVDHSLGEPAILIEPSSENLVDNYTSFQTTGSVLKASGIDAPDGTNTATRISNIAGATGTDAVYSRANSITPSSEITGSIYLRGDAGEIVRLYVKRYSGGTYVSTVAESVLLTGEWQRYESPSFTLNADNTNAAVTIRNDAETTADSVDLWGGQIELGSVSTSVIPTSGSPVTRASDGLVISGSDFTDFFNSSQGTYYVEAIDRTPLIQSAYIFGQGVGQYYLYSNTSSNVDSFDGTNFQSLPGVVANQPFRAAATFTSSPSKNISLNGQTTGQGSFSSTPDTHTGSWGAANILKIGNGYAGNTFNGFFKRVIFWPVSSDNL